MELGSLNSRDPIVTLDPIITLDVGGKLFKCYQSTLGLYHDSVLAKVFLYRKENTCQPIFFDRSPKQFQKVLDFLRSGVLPKDDDELGWCELDYWNVVIKPVICDVSTSKKRKVETDIVLIRDILTGLEKALMSIKKGVVEMIIYPKGVEIPKSNKVLIETTKSRYNMLIKNYKRDCRDIVHTWIREDRHTALIILAAVENRYPFIQLESIQEYDSYCIWLWDCTKYAWISLKRKALKLEESLEQMKLEQMKLE